MQLKKWERGGKNLAKLIREFNSLKKFRVAKIPEYPFYSNIEWEKIGVIQYAELKLSDSDSLKAGFESESGSIYWYTKKFLYRLSDHWGEVASCQWLLKDSEKYPGWYSHLARVRWDKIQWIPYKYRNPFYLFREQPEWIKNKLIKLGHVKPGYGGYYHIFRSFKDLNRIINWIIKNKK